MKRRYIVLRSLKNPVGFDPFVGPAAGPGPAIFSTDPTGRPTPAETNAQTKVDLEEMDTPGVARTRSLGDVVAVVPVMPTKLIAPRAASDAAPAALGTPAWGIAAVGATTSPLDGRGIIPAVLDTGIDAGHAAFAGVNLVQADFTLTDNGDGNGHGTHCAGTVFGRSVNGKRIGVAPGVGTALIGKVLDSSGGGSTEGCFRAIQWAADNGANVISMSLGIDFPGYVQQLTLQGVPVEVATSMALEAYRVTVRAYEQLMAFVKARGAMFQATVLVAAAGNENRPFGNPAWNITVAPPAVATGVLSVGAVGREPAGLQIAPFSNSGPNFVAPGIDIESARVGGGLASLSGTSMATPHAAGVAVLWSQWLQSRTLLTPFNLETRLAASATVTPLAAGFDSADVGLGIIQAPQTA